MTDHYDAIILGAGAAGMMCALRAGQRGRRVLIVEKLARPGAKILISGGGRCNFTNIHTAPDRFISANPHFVKSALSRYTPRDFLSLVEGHGIAWHEKTRGQLFCDGSARQIVDMLVAEVGQAGGTFALGQEIASVSHDGERFTVETQDGLFTAQKLVIATGGPSIPRMGATGFAYDLARQFGLKVVEPRPALVPLTLKGEDLLFRELSGVSSDVIARAGKAQFREAALFTHRGLSGPAILQISSFWRPGDSIAIDFFPDRPADWLLTAKREEPRRAIRNLLGEGLPERLAAVLAEKLALDGPLQEIADKRLRAAQERLSRWAFTPSGSEGFAKAEVTVGGIATAELSSQTMESKKRPGLYAIGEAVDVTGWLGGYNFQWAWASGNACGLAL